MTLAIKLRILERRDERTITTAFGNIHIRVVDWLPVKLPNGRICYGYIPTQNKGRLLLASYG